MKQEYCEYVQKGFRILLPSLSGYIAQKLNGIYKDKWWDKVREVLSDQLEDLPKDGSYEELVDSLDIANCIRLINREWNDVFRYELPRDCRTYANELMGDRNIVSHIGSKDLEQSEAERALDTMALLCKEIDPEGEEEIREIYKVVRSKSADGKKTNHLVDNNKMEVIQPGEGKGLLAFVGTDIVKKTSLTRKITFGGKTSVYPVYQVRLDALYYNNQNDRISTWITRYESENGDDSLQDLDKKIYNRVIEDFVVESHPESIQKTQKNIMLLKLRT